MSGRGSGIDSRWAFGAIIGVMGVVLGYQQVRLGEQQVRLAELQNAEQRRAQDDQKAEAVAARREGRWPRLEGTRQGTPSRC